MSMNPVMERKIIEILSLYSAGCTEYDVIHWATVNNPYLEAEARQVLAELVRAGRVIAQPSGLYTRDWNR